MPGASTERPGSKGWSGWLALDEQLCPRVRAQGGPGKDRDTAPLPPPLPSRPEAGQRRRRAPGGRDPSGLCSLFIVPTRFLGALPHPRRAPRGGQRPKPWNIVVPGSPGAGPGLCSLLSRGGEGAEPEAGPEPLGPQPLPVREAGAGSSLTVLLKMKTPRGCPRSFHERLSHLRADLSPGRACTAVSGRRRVPRPLSGECPGPCPRFPVRADPLCLGLGQPVTMPSTRNNALIVTAGPGSRRGNVRRGAPSYHARRERGWAPAHTKT